MQAGNEKHLMTRLILTLVALVNESSWFEAIVPCVLSPWSLELADSFLGCFIQIEKNERMQWQVDTPTHLFIIYVYIYVDRLRIEGIERERERDDDI